MLPEVGKELVPICDMDSCSDSVFCVHFETLGCRLNQIESESAAKCFSEAGFSVDMEAVSASCELSEAVLCVVNTCTVTGKAEQKARRLIRLLLRKYPKSCVLVTGCYAQLNPKEIESLDPRICVLPGSRKDLLAEFPKKLMAFLCSVPDGSLPEVDSTVGFIRGLTRCVSVEDLSARFTPKNAFRLSTDSFLVHSRSSVKIQDGCNNSCSYCRIRLARGNSVCLDASCVVERVQNLERQGQHEVVLTGVNLSQYRSKHKDGFVDLAGLLSLLIESTNKIRFRLSSLHPETVSDLFCQIIRNPRVQPHFHLSVQSGSDRILGHMGRSYNRECVLAAVEKLRAAKENPFVACDMIVGFPGETDEDFEETMDLCLRANFSWVHAFPFSPRPGTKAFSMKPVVPQSIVAKRISRLTEFAIESKCAYISLWSGKVVTAVTELSRSDRSTKGVCSVPMTHGVTENFLHVELPQKIPSGSLVHVRIIEPLVSRIRRGDECEATAHVVHDEKGVFCS